MPVAVEENVQNKLKQFNQEHLITHWGNLEDSQRDNLTAQINGIDFVEVENFFQECMGIPEEPKSPTVLEAKRLQPISPSHCASSVTSSLDKLQQYWHLGLEAIANGRVGVVLLAGGQGTRLGVSYPKGMYDVGLPSHKTLYQLQAERIIRLQNLAAEKFPHKENMGKIRWYIMTSEATGAETERFFEAHQYFGLESSQIWFFEQGLLPCFTFGGKMILEEQGKIAMAPDGNGGLYRALAKTSALSHLEYFGVDLLHVYCVDNILVRVADPHFIGYCLASQADCAAKVVAKVDPHEAVGVICQVRGVGPQVVEYSEIPREMAELRETTKGTNVANGDGKNCTDALGPLAFRAGNIANHFLQEHSSNVLLGVKKTACHIMLPKRKFHSSMMPVIL